MNLLTKWNPLRELEQLQSQLGSIFSRRPLRADGENLAIAEWAPLVDIAEDEKEFTITAELPDVKREDVKITAEDGMLRITGERKFEKEEKNKKFHRIERSFGSFERSFTLPEGIKKDAIAAEYKDGVLKVRVPKAEVAKPKSVDIKVG
jgi:HSP20 family protein